MARPRKEKTAAAEKTAAPEAEEKPAKATRKAKSDDVEASSINPDDLARHIKEIARQKELASEYAGNTGQATQQACDALGIHRKAIGMGVSLHRMEPAKRTALVSDLIKVLDGLGYLDEGTLFSSPRKQAEAAAEERKAPKESPMAKAAPPPPPAEDEGNVVALNTKRLEGIKPLDESTGGPGFAIQ